MLAQVEELHTVPQAPQAITSPFDRSIQRSMVSMVGHFQPNQFPQPYVASSSAGIPPPSPSSLPSSELEKMLRELPSTQGDFRDMQRSMMGLVNDMQQQQQAEKKNWVTTEEEKYNMYK